MAIRWDDEAPAPAPVAQQAPRIKWEDKPESAIVPSPIIDRMAQGLRDVPIALGQAGDVFVDPLRQKFHDTFQPDSPKPYSMADVQRRSNEGITAPEGFDTARAAGQMLNPINLMGGPQNATLREIATHGGMMGLTQPVEEGGDFIREKSAQIGGGTVLSAALARALRGVAKPGPNAQKLLDQGVDLSFGQAVAERGPVGNFINQAEQKSTSIPLVGDAAKWARDRALRDWSETAIERATAPGIRDLSAANDYASELYDSVVPHLVPTEQAKVGVVNALNRAAQNPELSPDAVKTLYGLTDKHLGLMDGRFDKFSGENLKSADSQLGFLARKYNRGSPADQALADELFHVQQGLRTGLEFGLPENLQGQLSRANKIYRELFAINKTASQRTDELVTPRNLQKQVARMNGQDVSRMAPDDFIQPGVRVLPNTVPDSGTAGRMGLGLGTLAVGAQAHALPTVLGVGGLAAAGATRTGQRALLGQTAGQKLLAPYSADMIGPLLAALRNRKRGDQQQQDEQQP